MSELPDVIIIGSGLSGLSVAHFLNKLQPDRNVLLLEKSGRPGGAVRSFHQAGFLAEWGPHGFLDNTPESREILADLGLDQVAQKAPLANFVRFVCHQGRLVQLPQSPKSLLNTPLLPLSGKLRLLADLWKKPRQEDQTIGQWAAYRFGKSVLPLVDAAVTGTFAGDYERLSIDAVMPGVRNLEKEAGSVLRGLIKKKKQHKAAGAALPAMTSFPEGMEQLTAALARGKSIRFNTGVRSLTKDKDGWLVQTGAESLRAPALVLALPVNQALQLLAPYGPPQPRVPVAKIVTVVLGFSDAAKVPYGFGYLAPERESRFALGAMFSTHMFPGRAPKGNVLLEALVGGRRHPERLDLDDDTLVSRVCEDLGQLMDLPERPWFTKVLRPQSGIPQLEMGHPALRRWQLELERQAAGLHICGFGWEGIGMNEMMKAARKAAENVAAGARQDQAPAAVKPVYF